MQETILIADNQPSQLQMTEYVLQRKLMYHTLAVSNYESIIRCMASQEQPDLILLALAMPGSAYTQAIRQIRSYHPRIPIILVVPYGDDKHAIAAIQSGANDYLTKPVGLERLKISIHNALKIQRMNRTIASLERNISHHVNFSDLIGSGPVLRNAITLATEASGADLPVWIDGECGTGKELLARAIHGNSTRAGKSFVVIDCRKLAVHSGPAAILFGKPGEHFGKLREADRGTAYFKDIHLLPYELQHRIQDAVSQADVRVICGSVKGDIIEEGRINILQRNCKGISISMPPLRN